MNFEAIANKEINTNFTSQLKSTEIDFIEEKLALIRDYKVYFEEIVSNLNSIEQIELKKDEGRNMLYFDYGFIQKKIQETEEYFHSKVSYLIKDVYEYLNQAYGFQFTNVAFYISQRYPKEINLLRTFTSRFIDVSVEDALEVYFENSTVTDILSVSKTAITNRFKQVCAPSNYYKRNYQGTQDYAIEVSGKSIKFYDSWNRESSVEVLNLALNLFCLGDASIVDKTEISRAVKTSFFDNKKENVDNQKLKSIQIYSNGNCKITFDSEEICWEFLNFYGLFVL